MKNKMLISIGGEFVDAKTISGLFFSCVPFLEGCCHTTRYELYVRNRDGERLCGIYATKEGAVKAMSEAAEKLNAVQGEAAAPKGKVTMKHMAYNSDDGDNMYCCARCKMWMQAYRWYKYCPNCGGEIKRWE